jgi:hypothetical protein
MKRLFSFHAVRLAKLAIAGPETRTTVHRNLRLHCLVIIAGTCLAGPLSAEASGSYCTCLPKPPARLGSAAKMDRDKFDLGQKVFNGKTAPVQAEAAPQRTRLQALQADLPEKVAAKKDVTALAGKLTDQQLEALEYFIKQRYPAK